MRVWLGHHHTFLVGCKNNLKYLNFGRSISHRIPQRGFRMVTPRRTSFELVLFQFNAYANRNGLLFDWTRRQPYVMPDI